MEKKLSMWQHVQFLKAGFSRLPALYKAIVAALVVVIVFLVSSSTEAILTRIHNKRFDSVIAKKEAQIRELEVRRDEAIKQAEKFETLAEDRAKTLAALYADVPKSEQKIEESKKQLDKAVSDYEASKSITNNNVPVDVRVERYCLKRKELGYPCQR